eukprot:INCI16161.2.p2 GENE.INCI16161.2~~INCI16161.2.p2  ORF type:complete len:111 (-),score=13.13 INCI16161.2:337-669(-)
MRKAQKNKQKNKKASAFKIRRSHKSPTQFKSVPNSCPHWGHANALFRRSLEGVSVVDPPSVTLKRLQTSFVILDLNLATVTQEFVFSCRKSITRATPTYAFSQAANSHRR